MNMNGNYNNYDYRQVYYYIKYIVCSLYFDGKSISKFCLDRKMECLLDFLLPPFFSTIRDINSDTNKQITAIFGYASCCFMFRK